MIDKRFEQAAENCEAYAEETETTRTFKMASSQVIGSGNLVPGKLLAEASSLGLAPGQWPERIEIEGIRGTFINVGPRVVEGSREGEIAAMCYAIPLTLWRLHVLND